MRAAIRCTYEMLALAAVYFIAAKIALLLAIPPGYATAVWPAAGIALAALLLRGNQLWTGVALGSFLANVATSLDATSTTSVLKSIVLPACLALGAAAQATTGAWLVRRYVGFPNPLFKEQAIFKFLGLGGPVACLVGATIGVLSLGIAGVVTWAEALFSWWTWWIGDTIGTLIFTPLIVIWAARPAGASNRRPLLVSLPMIATFAAAVFFFVYVRAMERSRVRREFEQRADHLAGAVEKNFERYVEMLHSIESFYAAGATIDGQGFRQFVDGFSQRHPGIQAISWNPIVLDADRAEFEAAARRDGIRGFEIREEDAQKRVTRAPSHPEYAVVRYVEPLSGNENVLGYNSIAEPNRRAAFNHARDTGQPVATSRIALVQDANPDPGMLVGVPIYRRGFPHDTIEQRRENLIGFVVGAFRVSDLMTSSLNGSDREGIEILLRDHSETSRESILYDDRTTTAKFGDLPGDPNQTPKPASILRRTCRFQIAGRQWELHFFLSSEYMMTHRSWLAWSVLARGLLFTGLLGAFIVVVTGRTEAIEAEVVERTLALQASEERTRLFAEHAPAAVAMFDTRMRYLIASAKWLTDYGLEGRSIIGRSHYEVFPDIPDHWKEVHQRCLAGSVESRDAESFDRVNRTRLWLRWEARPWCHGDGSIGGIVMFTVDITALKELEQQLVERNAALQIESKDAQQANRMKSEFLANMSHELRTPLNSIIGFSSFLAGEKPGPLNDKQKDFLGDVLSSSRHLLRLINDLLDFAKIEAGKLELEPESFSLGVAIAEVARVLRPLMHDKHLDFQVTVELANDEVTLDLRKVKQVLYNLLSNAIKFTQVGGQIGLNARLCGDGQFELRVTDTGVGIKREDFGKLFVAFTQLESSVEHRQEGTGLGLALTSKIVEMQRGCIAVESELGKGSTFTVTLPLVLERESKL